jgi:hypothetical protein
MDPSLDTGYDPAHQAVFDGIFLEWLETFEDNPPGADEVDYSLNLAAPNNSQTCLQAALISNLFQTLVLPNMPQALLILTTSMSTVSISIPSL